MRLYYLLLLIPFLTFSQTNPFLNKQGLNKDFFIVQNEVLDKEKSFSLHLRVDRTVDTYRYSENVYYGLQRYLQKNQIKQLDLSFGDDKINFESDYLIVINDNGWKVLDKDLNEILDVFTLIDGKSTKKRLKNMIKIDLTCTYIFDLSFSEVL